MALYIGAKASAPQKLICSYLCCTPAKTMARISIKEHSCKATRKRVHEFAPLRTYRALIAKASNLSNSLLGSKAIVGVNMWPSLECPAHLQKAQEDERMYRVSRAQHSIPEQQHYVCDGGVAKGSWGREHVFKRKEWTQLAHHPSDEYVNGRFLMHVCRSAQRRPNSPPR